jgi:hypothetical protein
MDFRWSSEVSAGTIAKDVTEYAVTTGKDGCIVLIVAKVLAFKAGLTSTDTLILNAKLIGRLIKSP